MPGFDCALNGKFAYIYTHIYIYIYKYRAVILSNKSLRFPVCTFFVSPILPIPRACVIVSPAHLRVLGFAGCVSPGGGRRGKDQGACPAVRLLGGFSAVWLVLVVVFFHLNPARHFCRLSAFWLVWWLELSGGDVKTDSPDLSLGGSLFLCFDWRHSLDCWV